jgi:hypothetical protein
LVTELKQQREDVDRLEPDLAKSQEDYAELEKLKDKEEVKAFRRRTADSEALQGEFDDLIEAVGTRTRLNLAKCRLRFAPAWPGSRRLTRSRNWRSDAWPIN